MGVLLRDEIVALQKSVDLKNKAQYITPKELKEVYDEKEDAIILDTRNDYEYKVEHFKNSIHLNIKNFCEFPSAIKTLLKDKNKKIITFCTGGIRCEKATAYMKEVGFRDVYQLKNGILTFAKEFPNIDFYVPGEHDEFVLIAYRWGVLTEKQILDIDCEIVSRCSFLVVFAPDDYISKGMQIEVDYCVFNKIPVISAIDGSYDEYVKRIIYAVNCYLTSMLR